MTRKIIVLFTAMMALALVLAGCGGGEQTTGNNGGNGGGEAAGEQTEGESESVAAGDAEAGESLYQQNCSACHGPDAKGLPNLGKDLTTSEFFHDSSNQEMLAFVKQGRPVSDPDNTTGIDMPPKGGNPALTDQQILDIIAYLRTLEE
ncbi:MAG: cytochrome c [Candidatus Promineifilaceae bacterium]|nr:cytochrome c [Candidatus Promineifilaceae bacterium]